MAGKHGLAERWRILASEFLRFGRLLNDETLRVADQTWLRDAQRRAAWCYMKCAARGLLPPKNWLADNLRGNPPDDAVEACFTRLAGAGQWNGDPLAWLPWLMRLHDFCERMAAEVEQAVRGRKRQELVAAIAPPAGQPEDEPAIARPQFTHSSDFAVYRWNGIDFAFTPKQAAIVHILHDARERGEPFVAWRSIRCALDDLYDGLDKIHDAFRSKRGPHPAFGVMIISAGRGRWKIAAPGDLQPAKRPKIRKTHKKTTKVPQKRPR